MHDGSTVDLTIPDMYSKVILAKIKPDDSKHFVIYPDIDIFIPDYDPDMELPYGYIKITNESGSTFTLGTTSLSTTGVTVTIHSTTGLLPGMEIN